MRTLNIVPRYEVLCTCTRNIVHMYLSFNTLLIDFKTLSYSQNTIDNAQDSKYGDYILFLLLYSRDMMAYLL